MYTAKEAKKTAYNRQLVLIKNIVQEAVNNGSFKTVINKQFVNPHVRLYFLNLGYKIIDGESTSIISWEENDGTEESCGNLVRFYNPNGSF